MLARVMPDLEGWQLHHDAFSSVMLTADSLVFLCLLGDDGGEVSFGIANLFVANASEHGIVHIAFIAS